MFSEVGASSLPQKRSMSASVFVERASSCTFPSLLGGKSIHTGGIDIRLSSGGCTTIGDPPVAES